MIRALTDLRHAEVQQQPVDGVAADHVEGAADVARLAHVVGVGLVVRAAGVGAHLQHLAELAAFRTSCILSTDGA